MLLIDAELCSTLRSVRFTLRYLPRVDMRFVCVLLLAAAPPFTIQKSTPEDAHYVAAVLEYNQDSSTDVNLANYLDFIRQAAEQKADIVVFPEMTLTRGTAVTVPVHGLLVDHPVPAINPDLYDNVLVQLSTAARNHQIYVVVNVQEELNCSRSQPGETCPGEQVYRFNTNVVFDRSGAVIDRYRKINLFGEYSRLASLDGSLGAFDTDFGVRFGHFICFDLMFQVPAVQVVQKLNVTDVIFSTMWFSEMPYLTAVEIQEGYAYAHNINFLASGASNVAVGSAGSGIYSGRAGALISTMSGVNTRKMLVSKVPKVPGNVEGMSYPGHLPNDPKVQDNLRMTRDLSLPAHVSRALRLSEEPQQFELRDGDITCSFNLQLRDLKTGGEQAYEYRATAFDGVRTFNGVASGGSRICSVVACSGAAVNSCSVRFAKYRANSTLNFSQLSITATVPTPSAVAALQARDAAYYPTSLDTTITPLSVDHYHYSERADSSGKTVLTLRLVTPQTELLSLGVWGRLYERDGDDPTQPNVKFENNLTNTSK